MPPPIPSLSFKILKPANQTQGKQRWYQLWILPTVSIKRPLDIEGYGTVWLSWCIVLVQSVSDGQNEQASICYSVLMFWLLRRKDTVGRLCFHYPSCVLQGRAGQGRTMCDLGQGEFGESFGLHVILYAVVWWLRCGMHCVVCVCDLCWYNRDFGCFWWIVGCFILQTASKIPPTICWDFCLVVWRNQWSTIHQEDFYPAHLSTFCDIYIVFVMYDIYWIILFFTEESKTLRFYRQTVFNI